MFPTVPLNYRFSYRNPGLSINPDGGPARDVAVRQEGLRAGRPDRGGSHGYRIQGEYRIPQLSIFPYRTFID